MAHGENHRIPPLTDRTWLVMYDAPSEYKNATAAATSSGVPIRRNGTIAARASRSAPASISVSIHPGATQFTVIRRFASSSASDFVAPISPAFDAA